MCGLWGRGRGTGRHWQGWWGMCSCKGAEPSCGDSRAGVSRPTGRTGAVARPWIQAPDHLG